VYPRDIPTRNPVSLERPDDFEHILTHDKHGGPESQPDPGINGDDKNCRAGQSGSTEKGGGKESQRDG